MIFGTCKLHTTRSGVMQILSKFCHNKHLTLEFFCTRNAFMIILSSVVRNIKHRERRTEHEAGKQTNIYTVSYTHLTLPTILRV